MTARFPTAPVATAATTAVATAAAVAVLAGLVVVGPAARAAPSPEPVVDAAAASAAVHTIDVKGSVRSILIRDTTINLRTEEIRGDQVRVTLNADVLFAFDKADLTPKARGVIANLAPKLRTARGPVRVDGYTDSIGTDAYNLDLSRRRASAVSDALRGSVPAGVTPVGHGEADPVAPNTTADGKDNPAGRALNRRVVVTYMSA